MIKISKGKLFYIYELIIYIKVFNNNMGNNIDDWTVIKAYLF